MAKRAKPTKTTAIEQRTGNGGETHQIRSGDGVHLITNHGLPLSDNQNSLKAGSRGPTLLEDFILREKITSFDHERIPERIVHARGSAAHGYFELTKSCKDITTADFLQRPGERTRVFTRFSTVAGGAGSIDLPRDVRGFAVKFYTNEGNFDLVGNNIPVFFIQDAMKFPDLVHSVKMEPDRGFPQAASAHDTFWDFISLMPESMHMIMWAMSDRGIPRSLRMIEGFGVNTFRLIDPQGVARFVKFHWRPKLGLQSVLWDEAVKISGADPDYHRRDLWEAIQKGDYPEWELGLQVMTEKEAAKLPFDILDATKLIPEELVPLRIVGRMVLDRNPDNFFAETEQVAYCPANIVPGIDFSEDPLLQGRIFSYLDTQLSRLGGPNFHEIPINQPICPMRNFQRDGHMRTTVPTGRVSYEPNTLAADGPRECPVHGFTTVPAADVGQKVRERSETFADHFSQARMFFNSQTPVEQGHIVAALVFELSKVETPAVRDRVISQLLNIDRAMTKRVAEGLGLAGLPEAAKPARKPIEMEPSPALSIIAKTRPTLAGRCIGMLVTDGVDGALVKKVQQAAKAAGTAVKIIAPKVGGVKTSQGDHLAADGQLAGTPSILFDAVVIAGSAKGFAPLLKDTAAKDFASNAFVHLKVIGHDVAAKALLDMVGVQKDAGVIDLVATKADAFIKAASKHKIWDREPKVTTPV